MYIANFTNTYKTMTIFEELTRRGLIAQMTHPGEIEEALNSGKVTFYVGFDATADSLHVGHMLGLIVMRRLQLAGHTPIALLGTGTTLIGDPTGRTDMRQMLTAEQISDNAELFRLQMSKILDFEGETPAILAKNGDWLTELNYIEFLRDVGRHFSVNKMLTAESVKSRLAVGLSFLEFNYMLLQSYDFLYLNQHFDCSMQLGGDDQWSNMLGGADLIRRAENKSAYALTFPLLVNKDGKKMGKTQKGALWLDKEKCSPYDFYQYWRNVDDADTVKLLKMLTFLPIEELEAMDSLSGAELNSAKELLAYEVTKLVHGLEEAEKARESAKNVFAGSGEGMPEVCIEKAESIGLLSLMVAAKLAPSNGEARRLVQGGGVSVDGVKMTEPSAQIALDKSEIVLQKGKKTFIKVIIS
jgi:tyrosyl-tRNA synthetase